MTKKVTRWFHPPEKPVRIGVYQTKRLPQHACWVIEGFSHWNGKKFGMQHSKKELARDFPEYSEAMQDKTWRGFTEEQK